MRVGIDIGGTFTDLVAAGADGVDVVKVASTPDDPARAFLDAQSRLPGEADEVRHGTTVATNAVLTRSGARLASLTTEGFRHLLQIARQDRPSLYDLRARRPQPLVDASSCVGVPERVGPLGDVIAPLDRDALRERLRDVDADSIAVCLLHAYANPEHERAVRDVVSEVLGPDVGVSLSSDLLPEFREYERASTTALNAYVQPAVERYLRRIDDASGAARVAVMWSGGGLRSIRRTAERPVQTLLSGPAAGVLAAAWVAQRVGVRDVVTLDMGGTSADVALVEDGRPLYAEEASLDGLPFRTPCVDVVSVGAGGGSVAWLDAGGALRVGPRSAGADPGPVAYGRGGADPTVTDAHVASGHLGGALAGGELELHAEAARAAVAKLARDAGLTPEDCASGILRVVRATMARAIRAVTVERGRDVRRFALVAFGGAGPLHGAALAAELGVSTVVVPPAPGALAALGLLVAGRRAEASVSRPMAADPAADRDAQAVIDELAEQALAELRAEGMDADDVSVSSAVDCRYAGQSHELRIPATRDAGFAEVVSRFHAAHRLRYGFDRRDAAVEAVTFRAVAVGPSHDVVVGASPAGRATRPVGERELAAWGTVPVFARGELGAGASFEGPAIVTDHGSTILVPPRAAVDVHASGALVMRL